VTIFLIKSLLSLLLLICAGLNMYTMFEIFGRGPSVASAGKFTKIHKASGYVYVLLFVLVSYLCIGFMMASKAEPSPRAALHIVLAYFLIVLFILKVLFVRVYRQFYAQARTIGIVMGVMTFVLVGISGGYYLAVSGLGKDRSIDKSAYYELKGPLLRVVGTGAPRVTAIRTDRLSIERGRTLFLSRCASCHDPLSTNTIMGPGLKGLLKNPTLPVSKNPATAESVRFQLRQPMGRMPSFAYLSEDEMNDLIAYLNTL
jgi:mono/diheme cytochrome c family protein